MKKALLISVFDQGVLSLLSLGMGVLLVRLASPEALGQFTLALSVFFVFGGVQYALVSLPISTRVFGRDAATQKQVIGDFSGFWLPFVTLASAVALPLLLWFGLELAHASFGAAMVATSLWRELSRSVHLALGQTARALAMDMTSVVLTLVGIAGLWVFVAPELACLGGLALGNGIGAALLGPKLFISPARVAGAFGFYRGIFPLTRWSLGDSLSAELQTRGYVFIVQLLRGDAANGLLQASRILFSPVSMVAQAWARVAVPRLAALIRAGDRASAVRITGLNMVALTGFALAYCAAIYVLWDMIEALLFDGRYAGVATIAIGWGAFSVLSAPAACLIMLFQAMERFRELALLGIANTLMVLGLVAAVSVPLPLVSVLVVLACGQLAIVIVLGTLVLRRPAPRHEATA